jgi:Fur family transcriptional regulator, ferric uptake regulator
LLQLGRNYEYDANTVSVRHSAPPLEAHDIDAAIDALRSRGLRVSAARRLVLEALFAADGPIAAEAIADGLAGRLPRSDLASVYRNLETLGSVGLVRHFHLGHGPGLYALATATEQEYLVCDSCNRIRTVDPDELDDIRSQIKRDFGYEARFSHFPIVGLCSECASETDDDADHRRHSHA